MGAVCLLCALHSRLSALRIWAAWFALWIFGVPVVVLDGGRQRWSLVVVLHGFYWVPKAVQQWSLLVVLNGILCVPTAVQWWSLMVVLNGGP